MWHRAGSGRCYACLASVERDLLATTGDRFYGRRHFIEKLWRDFFSDPSHWWDHRLGKNNPRYPDFKHKYTQQALWLVDESNPPWVEGKLAAITPGTLRPNIYSWNKKLASYVKSHEYGRTLELFKHMQEEGMDFNTFSFVPVLSACANLRSHEEGRHVHKQIIQSRCQSDIYVSSSLISMYAKCGSMEDAWRVFNKMKTRNVVSWSAMILGLVTCGQGWKALELSEQMHMEGVQPNSVTFVGLLNACASVAGLSEGRRVHEQIIQSGYNCDGVIGNCLVHMYVKCGSIEDAWAVFKKMPTRDVFAWSGLIGGYVKCGQAQKALELFQQMQQEGVEPDSVSFIGVLNACASLSVLEEGRRVHEQIIQRGYESEDFIGNCLVDMYTKCKSTGDAWRVFVKMPRRNVVSWTAMILGYAKCGDGQKALQLFWQMGGEGVEPNTHSFVGVLNACASIAALEEGRCIHEHILQRAWESDVYVANGLIDMYARCGSIEEAKAVFNRVATGNIVLWNAMLGGYAMHGHVKEALSLFELMCQEGADVDRVTFISLLSVCRHAGLVDEAIYYFESMGAFYCIPATVKHYACLVDLLARDGRLHEAENLIKTMPCEPNETVWMSLLGACKVHKELGMGELAAARVMELDPKNVAGCVLLSDLYATSGNAMAVNMLKLESLDKMPDCTWSE